MTGGIEQSRGIRHPLATFKVDSHPERSEMHSLRAQSKGGKLTDSTVVSFDCGARNPRPSAQDDWYSLELTFFQ
jgi:hypothetical protein